MQPFGGSIMRNASGLYRSFLGPARATLAEVIETRTFLNLEDLTTAFEDESPCPPQDAGPIQAPCHPALSDRDEDTVESGDSYAPELASLYWEASVGLAPDEVASRGV